MKKEENSCHPATGHLMTTFNGLISNENGLKPTLLPVCILPIAPWLGGANDLFYHHFPIMDSWVANSEGKIPINFDPSPLIDIQILASSSGIRPSSIVYPSQTSHTLCHKIR